MSSIAVESILSIEFIYCGCGCGKTRSKYNREGKECYFIKGHFFKSYKGKLHYLWKNGRRKSNEYVRILCPDHHYVDDLGYILEHRLVYEEFYKCCLLPWSDIHHLNGKKQDNKIENLEALIHGKHTLHHNLKKLEERRKEIAKRICSYCGTNKTPFNKQERYFIWYKNPKNNNEWLCNACYIKYKRGSIVI